MTTALIVVDVQNDFISGSLPVPDAQLIIPHINHAIAKFDTVVFTLDWHPANHCSFKENGGLWPIHCVEGTEGACFHKDLQAEEWDISIHKGTDPLIDSYSGFFDNDHKTATELHEQLNNLNIKNLTVCGLATDYCVKHTVLDALSLGYRVSVYKNGCRGLAGADEALVEMARRGASIIEESLKD